MKRVIFQVCLVFLLASNFLAAQTVPDYRIMTEEYPPYNYTDGDGELTGFSTEVVQELCRRLGHHEKIEVLPWSRAYHILEITNRTLLFSMARTDMRENQFRWVGPLAHYDVVCFALKSRGISLSSENDMKRLNSIGSGLNTSTSQELAAKGFTNLDLVADSNLNVRKLMSGRISVWLSGRLSGIYRMRQQGFDPSRVEAVYVYRQEPLYIAFNKDTPEFVIDRWQNELDEMKADGTYQEILSKYLE